MYIQNDLAWNFVSIYYSRDSWKLLIDELTDLKKRLTNEYVDFIIFFSEEKGENIRMAVSSMPANYNRIRSAIENLNKIIKANPSELSHSFPYGKTLWKNHENNSLIWNTFTINEPRYDFRHFEQAISNLLLELLDDDYTSDNFLTAGLYLFVKILKQTQIHENKITEIINEAIDSLSEKFENFELQSMIDNIILEYLVDESSVFHTLDDYWHEINDSHSFIEWSSSTEFLIEHKIDFKLISQSVLDHLGLGRSHNMLILVLLYRWSLSWYYELNKTN
jgi:hypothetical protein